MTAKTPWFPASVKPVRHGYYDVRVALRTGKQSAPKRFRFDGEWHFDTTGKPFGKVAGDEWRGLSADPNTAGPGFLPKKLQEVGK